MAKLKGASPVRYVSEESSLAGMLLRSDYTCQRWGVAIRHADGTLKLEFEPAPRKVRVKGISGSTVTYGSIGCDADKRQHLMPACASRHPAGVSVPNYIGRLPA